jgi:hypothetical protein
MTACDRTMAPIMQSILCVDTCLRPGCGGHLSGYPPCYTQYSHCAVRAASCRIRQDVRLHSSSARLHQGSATCCHRAGPASRVRPPVELRADKLSTVPIDAQQQHQANDQKHSPVDKVTNQRCRCVCQCVAGQPDAAAMLRVCAARKKRGPSLRCISLCAGVAMLGCAPNRPAAVARHPAHDWVRLALRCPSYSRQDIHRVLRCKLHTGGASHRSSQLGRGCTSLEQRR